MIVCKTDYYELFHCWWREPRKFLMIDIILTLLRLLYGRVLLCAQINIYILKTRVTSLICLKRCVERPFIPPCFNRLLTEEPFTSTNGEWVSNWGLFASQAPERNFARGDTLRKPVNLEHSVCVYPGSGPTSLVPSQGASLHSNYRSVRSALSLSRSDEDTVVKQISG